MIETADCGSLVLNSRSRSNHHGKRHLAQAKEHLEELIERASRGEDVRIVVPGGTVKLQPVGAVPDAAAPRVTDTMSPFVPPTEERKLGHLQGKMKIPARLKEPMSADELREWYGDDT